MRILRVSWIRLTRSQEVQLDFPGSLPNVALGGLAFLVENPKTWPDIFPVGQNVQTLADAFDNKKTFEIAIAVDTNSPTDKMLTSFFLLLRVECGRGLV